MLSIAYIGVCLYYAITLYSIQNIMLFHVNSWMITVSQFYFFFEKSFSINWKFSRALSSKMFSRKKVSTGFFHRAPLLRTANRLLARQPRLYALSRLHPEHGVHGLPMSPLRMLSLVTHRLRVWGDDVSVVLPHLPPFLSPVLGAFRVRLLQRREPQVPSMQLPTSSVKTVLKTLKSNITKSRLFSIQQY